ncbi:hypothetical protein [Geoalkalibacter subterraneus]|uniref:Flagellar biosynthesis protein FlgN n=1 Tax=Geoalkalibacter subterraneus TaxID=483547 RepID=A0A0B5FVG1_9BACT|nr:hypothetical protein [Geoalkalibacter subterraneus]AJF07566.1 hypothetical protein GSUB_14825 [Geoalkalibacter subterraneus]
MSGECSFDKNVSLDEVYKTVDLSISQYRDILDALERFGETLGKVDSEQISLFAEELRQRQQQAAEIDADVERGVCALNCKDATLEAVLERRTRIMARVREHNQLLSEKIRGMMSVISEELTQARIGKAAMSGYRGQDQGKGSILTSIF